MVETAKGNSDFCIIVGNYATIEGNITHISRIDIGVIGVRGIKMDLISLVYDDMDVYPAVVLHHFLRLLGFYVNECTGLEYEDEGSIAVFSGGMPPKK